MKTGWKIGIMTLAGIGLGTWVKLKFYPQKPCTCKEHKVQKVIGQTEEDSFSPHELIGLKTTIAQAWLEKKNRTYLKDLARWGTREGIIEVSDLFDTQKLILKLKAIQKGRRKNLGTPSNLKQLDTYLQDLEKWGTREGIIAVSNDEQAAKKKQEQLKKMVSQGKVLAKHYAEAKPKKSYAITQVTLENTSEAQRKITLWEANRSTSISPTQPTDVADHQVIHTLRIANTIHPQGMAVNPKNQLTYVANQLSNNVSVIGLDGQLIRLIPLEPSNYSGLNSPVAIAIHTNPASPNYGFAYVIGSVANTVSIINLDFEVVATLAVGLRPLSVVYNPINDRLIVAHYAENTLASIKLDTQEVETIVVEENPLAIAVHPQTGTMYVAHQNTIRVLDKDYSLITLIKLDTKPTKIAYHPSTHELYVVAPSTDEVVVVATDTYQVVAHIPVGKNPFEIMYNENNDFMYVASRGTNPVTVIAPDKTIQATLELPVSGDLVINPSQNTLFTTDTTGAINVIGYQAQSSSILVDTEYEEKNQAFQHNPAIIEHAKFILSGTERFSTLKLRQGHATGNSTIKTLSFTAYDSPQNAQNVSEVYGLKGAIIDGSNGWILDMPPKQTLTILLYYKSFDRYHLLPETSPKAIGVTMSRSLTKKTNI